jgi:hypothetical protein
MHHGAMLLCSALNLIFDDGRISGSGKANGAEAKWTQPFEECQLVYRTKKSRKAFSAGRKTRRAKIRTMLMSTAATGLVATLLTAPAQADHMCRKVCPRRVLQKRMRVWWTSPLHATERDTCNEHDRYNHLNHRHDMRGPGVNVEINR